MVEGAQKLIVTNPLHRHLKMENFTLQTGKIN